MTTVGSVTAWFLDKVIITNQNTKEAFYFLFGRWFAKDEDDGKIEREVPASTEDGQTYAPLKKYLVQVQIKSVCRVVRRQIRYWKS